MHRRWVLWSALAALVIGLLGVLVWLAGRYETTRWHDRLESDLQQASTDMRAGLLRNVQSIQVLTQPDVTVDGFDSAALRILRERRELLRLEHRLPTGQTLHVKNTPYRPGLRAPAQEQAFSAAAQAACASAERTSGPAYGYSEYVPQSEGLGFEQMVMCLPVSGDGQPRGFLLATYSLQGLLSELVPPNLTADREISFTEGDGTRLAIHGKAVQRLTRAQAQVVFDLPGNPLVLRIEAWRGAPDLFPNVLTALVATMTLGLLGVMTLLARDMRKRLAAEHSLADALAFRKAMEDSLITGLRARDNQGRITYVNPAFCEMVGFAAQELLGQSIPAPYWPPEQVQEYMRRQQIRLAGNAPPREGYESVFMRKSGERFPVLVMEAPLINSKGEQTGWMSAILDVSEQRRVEEISRTSQERLQASSRLATVGEMASLLSHELNQPLAAISSYANGSLNLLQTPDADKAEIVQAIARVAEQAERAGKVIQSINDFVRQRSHERQAVQPRVLIDSVMPLIQLQAKKSGVRIELDCPASLPHALCDRTMVEQVLLNLARNGLQAMADMPPERRCLALAVQLRSAERAQPWLAFSVTDAGVGIDAQVAEKLFTPFFSTKPEGMGMGLSLCRTVIEQHGGFLAYQQAPGGGTVFTFTLPTART